MKKKNITTGTQKINFQKYVDIFIKNEKLILFISFFINFYFWYFHVFTDENSIKINKNLSQIQQMKTNISSIEMNKNNDLQKYKLEKQISMIVELVDFNMNILFKSKSEVYDKMTTILVNMRLSEYWKELLIPIREEIKKVLEKLKDKIGSEFIKNEMINKDMGSLYVRLLQSLESNLTKVD